MLKKLFNYYKENGQIIFVLFGIKIKFKHSKLNYLEDVCFIQNLQKIKDQGTYFPHPVGIVIHPDVNIGKKCVIFQNVTIGAGRYINGVNVPTLGNNVTVYANAVIVGGVTIGNNVVIGAGSVVVHDIPDNSIAVGNPAKVIKKND